LNSSEYLFMKKLHLQKSNFWGAVHMRVVLIVVLTPYFINMEAILSATIYFLNSAL
jgi:hypothetical protein